MRRACAGGACVRAWRGEAGAGGAAGGKETPLFSPTPRAPIPVHLPSLACGRLRHACARAAVFCWRACYTFFSGFFFCLFVPTCLAFWARSRSFDQGRALNPPPPTTRLLAHACLCWSARARARVCVCVCVCVCGGVKNKDAFASLSTSFITLLQARAPLSPLSSLSRKQQSRARAHTHTHTSHFVSHAVHGVLGASGSEAGAAELPTKPAGTYLDGSPSPPGPPHSLDR